MVGANFRLDCRAVNAFEGRAPFSKTRRKKRRRGLRLILDIAAQADAEFVRPISGESHMARALRGNSGQEDPRQRGRQGTVYFKGGIGTWSGHPKRFEDAMRAPAGRRATRRRSPAQPCFSRARFAFTTGRISSSKARSRIGEFLAGSREQGWAKRSVHPRRTRMVGTLALPPYHLAYYCPNTLRCRNVHITLASRSDS